MEIDFEVWDYFIFDFEDGAGMLVRLGSVGEVTGECGRGSSSPASPAHLSCLPPLPTPLPVFPPSLFPSSSSALTHYNSHVSLNFPPVFFLRANMTY